MSLKVAKNHSPEQGHAQEGQAGAQSLLPTPPPMIVGAQNSSSPGAMEVEGK